MAADNNDYQQFNKIKNDAIRRSNEMHKRSAAQQQNNNASQCSAKAEHSGCGKSRQNVVTNHLNQKRMPMISSTVQPTAKICCQV